MNAKTSTIPWIEEAVSRGDRWVALIDTPSQRGFERFAHREYDCIERPDGVLLVRFRLK